MRSDAIWSEDLGCYVAPPLKSPISRIKLPALAFCEIVITDLGYFNLTHRGKIIKRLNLEEYLRARDHVKNIIGKELLQ